MPAIQSTFTRIAPQDRHHDPMDRPFNGDDMVPSGPLFIALLQAFRSSGGTATGAVVGNLLAEHRHGGKELIESMICTRQVFGFFWRRDLWVPMFQFDADLLSVRASAQQARAMLPATWSGWEIASWFACRQNALQGRRPVDLFHSDTEVVLQAAARAGA